MAIEAVARTYAPAAVRSLARVATHGKSESARVAAATAILDRGYGRPRQSVDLDGNLTIRDLSDAQLDERLAQLLGKT